MSDTPRTDAKLVELKITEQSRHGYKLDGLAAYCRELERELAVARKGLEAVASLMDESSGVGGLHLNGDFAPWSELRTGGRFEEWLVAFDDALNAARSSNPQVSRDGGKEDA
jgi:hypothetical protein